jgi:hypothetical protein
MEPMDKTWDEFKIYFNNADKDLRFLATMGPVGYRGVANMAIMLATSILVTTHVALIASEEALAASLARQTITPIASVATTASNVSIMMPHTTPEGSSARS